MIGAEKTLSRPYQQYRQVQAQTADRGELVLMLYQGALRFLAAARTHLGRQQLEEANAKLLRAQEILVELMGALDWEAGELADGLYRLYAYMHRRLTEANVQKDHLPIVEVEALLRQLLEAWKEAVQTGTRKGPHK